MKALKDITFSETQFNCGSVAQAVAKDCQATLYNLMWDRYQKSLRREGKSRSFQGQWDPDRFMSNFTGYLLELALVKYLGLPHQAWVDIRLEKYQADPELDEHLPDVFPNIEVRSFNKGVTSKDLRPRLGLSPEDCIWVFGSVGSEGVGRLCGWIDGSDIREQFIIGPRDKYGKPSYNVGKNALHSMESLRTIIPGLDD